MSYTLNDRYTNTKNTMDISGMQFRVVLVYFCVSLTLVLSDFPMRPTGAGRCFLAGITIVHRTVISTTVCSNVWMIHAVEPWPSMTLVKPHT